MASRFIHLAIVALLFSGVVSKPSEYIDSLFEDDSIEELDPGILPDDSSVPDPSRETPEGESIGKDVSTRTIVQEDLGSPSPTGSRLDLEQREYKEISIGHNDEKRGQKTISDEMIAVASVSSAGALATILCIARFLWRAYNDGVLAFAWADAIWDRLQLLAANIRHPRIGGRLAIGAP